MSRVGSREAFKSRQRNNFGFSPAAANHRQKLSARSHSRYPADLPASENRRAFCAESDDASAHEKTPCEDCSRARRTDDFRAFFARHAPIDEGCRKARHARDNLDGGRFAMGQTRLRFGTFCHHYKQSGKSAGKTRRAFKNINPAALFFTVSV